MLDSRNAKSLAPAQSMDWPKSQILNQLDRIHKTGDYESKKLKFKSKDRV